MGGLSACVFLMLLFALILMFVNIGQTFLCKHRGICPHRDNDFATYFSILICFLVVLPLAWMVARINELARRISTDLQDGRLALFEDGCKRHPTRSQGAQFYGLNKPPSFSFLVRSQKQDPAHDSINFHDETEKRCNMKIHQLYHHSDKEFFPSTAIVREILDYMENIK